MKQKFILNLVVVTLLCATPVLAKDNKKDAEETKRPAPTPVEMTGIEKDFLAANIEDMRNQEVRVAILQQVLTEEIAKLRNKQALFCDKYNLDIEKFRKGLYRYDDKQGKFVLIESKPATAK